MCVAGVVLWREMGKHSGQQGGGDAEKRATREAMGLTAWRGVDDPCSDALAIAFPQFPSG